MQRRERVRIRRRCEPFRRRLVQQRWVFPMAAYLYPAVLIVLMMFADAHIYAAAAKDMARLMLQLAHTSKITALAYSRDGRLFASGAADGTVKIWQVETARQMRTFAGGGAGPIDSLAFSSDGKLLSSQNIWISIWDLSKQDQPVVIGRCCKSPAPPIGDGEHFAIDAAFSPDGKSILSTDDHDTPVLWSLTKVPQARRFVPKQKPTRIEGLAYTGLALSPDGRLAASLDLYGKLKLWAVRTGSEIWSISLGNGGQAAPAFSPDGQFILAGPSGVGSLTLVRVASGEAVRRFEMKLESSVASLAGFGMFCGKSGRYVVAPSSEGEILVWETASARRLRGVPARNGTQFFLDVRMACSPDGRHLLSAAQGDTAIREWNLDSRQVVRSYSGFGEIVSTAAISQDGKVVISGGSGGVIRVWDALTGRLVRTLSAEGEIQLLRFLPGGRHFMSGAEAVKIREIETGATVATLMENRASHYFHLSRNSPLLLGDLGNKSKLWDAISKPEPGSGPSSTDDLAVSYDGSLAISRAEDGGLLLRDPATNAVAGKLPGKYEVYAVAFSPDGRTIVTWTYNEFTVWDVATRHKVKTFAAGGGIEKLVISPDGKRLLSGGRDNAAKLWDLAAGREIAQFRHDSAINDIAFVVNSGQVLTASSDGTVGLWKVDGRLLAKFAGLEKNWLTSTDAGYFDRGGDGELPLHVVRGAETYPVAQFQDHLYRPDLVEALLKGDSEGKYADAASKLNLEAILDSGPAPQIEAIPRRKTERIGDTITIALRLVDTGGGIGEKVVWRVNGITQGEVSDPNAARTGYRVAEQTLRLAPGQDNIVEVTAYNGAGLLASTPWRHVEGKFGEPSGARMHILAVGVSTYAKPEWRLKYADKDAQAFVDLMQAVAKGKGLYDDVRPSLVLESDATEKGIEAAIERMRGEVGANDVFILYLAGHGRNIAGMYYFIPQDLTTEGGRTIQKNAIDQDKLQRWLARIPAQKSILILDTCESEGAARSPAVERETAVERLRHATGRSVIAAASTAAFEGYEGHGLLSWAIRDAFTERQGSGGEFVGLLQLADHIDAQVPVISQKWLGVVQRPHSKIEGNFPLGAHLAGLADVADAKVIPKTATHVLIRLERVRERPAVDAPGERELSPGTQVHLVRLVEKWAVVAREGQELGYVPADALVRLQ